ncbi:hypothetical protein [Nocardia africana]|uniref:Uncharacterized protein n=1 Tax=Nocardia africana TaxID=134964 RepID=A0A378WUS3_9NOCA|nr:hypothetical protein [Nocardia africana]MCC3313650.1 hypothetical protein [Nocardia africana]SUA44968.1 Uncharacterised protein [Nocardia africana]
MKWWIRPAGLSLGLATLGVLLLIDDWAPARAAWFATGWLVATALVFAAEQRSRTRR